MVNECSYQQYSRRVGKTLSFPFNEFVVYAVPMRFTFLAALLIITGCATASHVVTGTVHPATVPEAVKIYAVMPEKAEVIGLVSAENPWAPTQGAMSSSMEKLKIEAAKLGANGVVINTQDITFMNGATVSGTAVFLQP
jgi:hypothetical protein